jgi:hypothetical protein
MTAAGPQLTAWAKDGGRTVDVSAWGRRLNLYPVPGHEGLCVDPAAADAVLAAAGYTRAGEWIAVSGECRAAHLTALPGTVTPGGDEWGIRLPLTGAAGPLVTFWFTNGAGERYAAEITYPDGARCHLRLASRALSWADRQVWDNSNRRRYQLTDYYCPGHGPSGICEYGAHDEIRYTGPLTEPDSPSPAVATPAK